MRASSSIFNFKILLKVSFFSAVLLAVMSYGGEKYQKASEQNTINAFTKARFDDFYALEENSLDMVFIGSSHAYCTFDPENFDKALGTSSFQMGTPLQHPDTSYYELLEIYRTQNPKVVVMEVYWDMLDDDFEMKQADSFFQVLKNDSLRKEYIRDGFPLGEKIKYFIPIIRYQQDYLAYEANEIQKKLEEKYQVQKPATEAVAGTEYYVSKGYVYCDVILQKEEYDKTNKFKGLDGKDWQWSKNQREYLEKIIALCKEKDSQLIFVTAPVANVSMEYIENYDSIHDKISDFAAENQIPYLDYNIINKEEKLLENENFRDDAHLNDSGVKIVDRHFLQWLVEKGIFS